jgi:hypothetical protein
MRRLTAAAPVISKTNLWRERHARGGTRAFGRGDESAAPFRCGAASPGSAVRAAGRGCLTVILFSLFTAVSFPVLAYHAIGHDPELTQSPAAP